jgi:transcription termination factor Rho
MYDKSELEGKLLNELRDIAKQYDIRKSDTMKKQDLVYQILDQQAANPTPDILEAEKKARVFPQKGARQRIPIEKLKEVRKVEIKPKQERIAETVIEAKIIIPEILEGKAVPIDSNVEATLADPTAPPKRVVTPYEPRRNFNKDDSKIDNDTPSVRSFERPESTNVPAWELQEFHERRRRGRRPQDRDDNAGTPVSTNEVNSLTPIAEKPVRTNDCIE